MAKKSFKENNPAMQFITPPKETQEDQALQSAQKSKDAKEKGSDKVKAAKENKGKEDKIKEDKVKEDKAKKSKVKETKIKEENIVQTNEDDKEKKFARIDKILTKENLRYLKAITHSEGVSVSDYINRLVTEDQAKRPTVI